MFGLPNAPAQTNSSADSNLNVKEIIWTNTRTGPEYTIDESCVLSPTDSDVHSKVQSLLENGAKLIYFQLNIHGNVTSEFSGR